MQSAVHYNINLQLGRGNYETALGGWLQVLESSGWGITKVSSVPQINASLQREMLEDIHLQITRDNKALHLHFYTGSINTSQADLELLATNLQDSYVSTLEENGDINLQYKYRQTLKSFELQQLSSTENEGRIKWVLRVLFTGHPAQAVGWLMLINVAVFIGMLIDGNGIFDTNIATVIKWGAADKALVMAGGYWRLFTANFIQFDLGHLLGNIIGMLYASAFLMLAVSRWQMVAGYLATGLVAMAVSIWWHADTTTAGASGAIFGMYGMLLGLVLTPIFGKSDRITIIVYLCIYAGINLLYGIKDGIDNAAHIGGLLAGIPIGLLYSIPWHFNTTKWQRAGLVVITLVLGVLGATLFIKNTHYFATDFFRLEKEYSNHENAAIDIYNTSDSTLAAKVSASRQAQAIFKIAQPFADSMADVKETPESYKDYARQLSTYNQYRIVEFGMLTEYYEGTRNGDDDSLNLMSLQVDSMLKLMKVDK